MRRMEWRRGILIGILLLICAWLASLIWGLGVKTHIAVSEATDAKHQYEELEARKASLQANVEALNTERGQDAAIRTAFGVARPGEEVIVVVPPAPATTTQEMSWWQKFLSWF
jgi:cell division protein FtsB